MRRRASAIGSLLTAMLLGATAFAQLPRFRDQTVPQYYVGTPITPVAPVYRPTSGPVPPNIYGEVTTIAGNGAPGFANGNGKNASFTHPSDIKLDAACNLYVADAGNNCIRKIDKLGNVTTFAGSGTAGYAEGLGTAAKFNGPTGIVFDKAGNLFVADRENNLIREIDPLGNVTLFAGVPGATGMTNNTFALPTGVAFDQNGRLFVTDQGNMVREVPGGYVTPFAGSDYRGVPYDYNGPGVKAKFASLWPIFGGADNILYVGDVEMVRTINSSAIVGTAAGRNQAREPYEGDGANATFTRIQGICMDDAGTMFFSDGGGNVIWRFGKKENYISIVAGVGKQQGYTDAIGKYARFGQPMGNCIDADGFLYVCDATNNAIRKVSTTGFRVIPDLPPGLVIDQRTGIISGTPTKAWPATTYTVFGYNTTGMGSYSFTIQVNEFARRPQKIDFVSPAVMKETDPDYPLTGTVIGPANSNPIRFESSDISVVSISDNKIHILGPGKVKITAYKDEDPSFYAATPVVHDLTVEAVEPTFVYPEVKPKGNPVIIKLGPDGSRDVTYDNIADVTGEYQYQQPSTTIKQSHYDCSNVGPQTAVLKTGFGPDPADPLSAKFNYPSNLVFDPKSGNIYIADKGNYQIRKIGTDTRVTTLAGSGSPGTADGKKGVAGFGNDLLSITTDNQGNIYVCDVANKLIRKVTPDGVVSTFAPESLNALNDFDPIQAIAIAIDKSGYIYIADKNRIYKATPDGSSATVFAGSGKEAQKDGVGVLADLNGIKGLYFGPNGNLYVTSADPDYVNTLRVISPAGVVTTKFNKTDPLLRFTRLVVDSKGNAFIASTEPKIYEVASDGTFSIFAGSPARIGNVDGDGKTTASFNDPQGIAIDPEDNMYIADQDNHIIRKITPGGFVSTIAGSGIAGHLDNSSLSNKKEFDIPVIIVSPITIDGTYSAVDIPYMDACPAVLPDYTAAAKGTSPCTGNITFTQTPAAGKILNNGETVTVTLTAHDGLSAYDDVSVTFPVTASKMPTPTVSISPVHYEGCDQLEAKFTATTVNEGRAATYEWFLNGVSKYQGGPEFVTTDLQNGDKVTCVVTNNDGCAPLPSAPSNAATVKLDASTTVDVKIFPSVTEAFCPGTTVTFNAFPVNPQSTIATYNYQWRLNGQSVGADQNTYATNKLKEGDVITCDVAINGHCILNPQTTTNAITIHTLGSAACDILPPNTFTPNGDGINDTWQIITLQNFPSSTVSVYDRNGQLIYQSTGYARPWDGTYRGKQLPAGTYYYLIDTHTYRSVIAGWVAIIR